MNRTIQVIPTLDTNIYASGDALHTGALALTTVVRAAESASMLQNLTLLDTAAQSGAIDLLFFSANPADSTVTANAAFVLHANDLTKYRGRVSIAATDYVAMGSGKVEATIRNIGYLLGNLATTTGYIVLVARGAYTYAAASLTLTQSFLQDA